MNKLTCALFAWILMLFGSACFAQQTTQMADSLSSNGRAVNQGANVADSLNSKAKVVEQAPEMADVMRSNGKIYVVVAVCLIILFGLLIYVVSVDKKISRLEKNNK